MSSSKWLKQVQNIFNKKGIDQAKQNIGRKIMIIVLPTVFNILLGCSKEPSHWDGSF